MRGAASAPPRPGLTCCMPTASGNSCSPAGSGGRRSRRCGRTGGLPSSSPGSGCGRSATTGCCRPSSRSWSAKGFAVIDAPMRLLEDGAVMPEGQLGKLGPDPVARADIEHGLRVARAIGALDIGQSVVVQQGMVLGVEAIEGTDALLRRCGLLRREGPGGVLIKIEKPGQERRADRPVIGPQTVAVAAEAGLRGIAAEAWCGARSSTATRWPARPTRRGLFVVGVPRSHERGESRGLPFIFIVTGQPSGEAIGGALIAAPKERTGGTVRVAGIGGERMAEQGLTSLVPLADLAVAGVAEVLPRARTILRHVRNTTAAIRTAARPDAVVTIDELGLHLAHRPSAAQRRRDIAADPLRRADGVGVAREPGAAGGALVRPSADAAAVRAALFRARGVGEYLRRPPDRRKRRRGRWGWRAVPGRARHRGRYAGAERAAGKPEWRGKAPVARFRRGAAGARRTGRAVSRRGADGRACRRDGCRRGAATWPGRTDRRARRPRPNTMPSPRAGRRWRRRARWRWSWRWRGCRWRSPIASAR